MILICFIHIYLVNWLFFTFVTLRQRAQAIALRRGVPNLEKGEQTSTTYCTVNSLLTDYDLRVMIDWRGPIVLVQNFR
jgi:hypothetical protein